MPNANSLAQLKRRQTIWTVGLRITPWLLILYGVYLLFVFVQGMPVEAQSDGASPELLTSQLNDLKEKISDQRDRLTLLLAFAGVYALIQGFFGFFSVQNYSKQADDIIKRIEKQADDVQRSFPNFAQVEKARVAALNDLAKHLENTEWRADEYEKLDFRIRQRILSVENVIGIEFLHETYREQEIIANLRRLGQFYAIRYLYRIQAAEETQTPGETHGPVSDERRRAHREDLDRAEYYLHLARDRSDNAFYTLNDLGVLYCWGSGDDLESEQSETKDERLEKAKELFEQSLRKKPNQRAAFCLANIHDEEGSYMSAVHLLERAVDFEDWEEGPQPHLVSLIHYNICCGYCRRLYEEAERLSEDEKTGLSKKAFAALENAIGIANRRIHDSWSSQEDHGVLRARYDKLRRDLREYMANDLNDEKQLKQLEQTRIAELVRRLDG